MECVLLNRFNAAALFCHGWKIPQAYPAVAADAAETALVKALWHQASRGEALISSNAYFDRPYGPWAVMVYNRAATYASKLRQIKAELARNNILNPGKLCFA